MMIPFDRNEEAMATHKRMEDIKMAECTEWCLYSKYLSSQHSINRKETKEKVLSV